MADHRLFSFLLLIFLFSQVSASSSSSSSSSSSFSAALQTLQKQIGYEFKTVDLLRRAVTHPSYSLDNYRTLSILGLSAVEAAIALDLLQSDLDASATELSRRIQSFASVDACAVAGLRLGLEKIVRISARTNATAPSVVCGAFRAVFGGVALDSGSVGAAGEVFWRVQRTPRVRVSAA